MTTVRIEMIGDDREVETEFADIPRVGEMVRFQEKYYVVDGVMHYPNDKHPKAAIRVRRLAL